MAAVTPDHGRGIVLALVLLLLAANLLAAGVWLARRRAERNRFAPEMPTPRAYDGPGRELDFGPGGRESPERPEEAGDPALRDRRGRDY